MKKIFYGAFSVFLLGILVIVIRHPSNNLIPSRMILFTAIWIGFLYGIRILLQLIEKWIQKKDGTSIRSPKTG